MTDLRKDAFELLEKMPEDKLTFIIQIMQGVDGLYNDDGKEKEAAFYREKTGETSKKATDIDAVLQSLLGAVPYTDISLSELREERLRKYESFD